MFNKSILISFTIFFSLMIFTSHVKNKTRNLEKNIEKLQREISSLEKKLSDTQIDFVYLSSPEQLQKNSLSLVEEEYLSFDHSRIFLSVEHFLKYNSKEVSKIKK
tara:strand:+ start:60 stop:374 length:315 start_codon:yes stop_codon:yes gene_type:complete